MFLVISSGGYRPLKCQWGVHRLTFDVVIQSKEKFVVVFRQFASCDQHPLFDPESLH